MGQAATIERATRDDLEDILGIERACFPVGDGFSRRQFLYLIAKANGCFYVIKEHGKAVAYLALLFNDRASIVRIYSIAVRPEARGKHFGDMLMRKAIETAIEKRMRTVSLEVHTGNTVAINMYRKYGFAISGTRKGYYADGSDAHIMRMPV